MFAKRGAAFLFASLLAGQFDNIHRTKRILDAHNCYPYNGKWADRIDRALTTGTRVAIEQDIAWYEGRVVVSHTAKTKGSEPLLKDYFFEHVRPMIEKALKENKPETWPLIVLHFDFKDNQPALLHAVWEVLGEYKDWISTAPKSGDPHLLTPLKVRPLLVLTEDSDEQEKVFFDEVAPGEQLRVFGSAHTLPVSEKDAAVRNHLLATLAPGRLLAERPTNYRRWWNNSWYEVEEGGQAKASEWTSEDEARLRALVDHAHRLGFWIRVRGTRARRARCQAPRPNVRGSSSCLAARSRALCAYDALDGFKRGSGQGWDSGYNFGSRAAVEKRSRAALAAGVNLIATDQYEDLAEFMKR